MDKAALQKDIQTTFDHVIETIKNISDKLINQIPFENSWTIGQVAEHIIICSRGIPDNNVKEAERQYDENVADLKSIFLDMDEKSEADPAVKPKMTEHAQSWIIENLESNKKQMLAITDEKDLTQLCIDMEFPYMGYLTRFEWLNFIAVHTQRHLNQIQNINQYLSANN